MKRLLLIILVCVVSTGFANCGKKNEVAEKNAQAVADAFEDNDMDAINKTVFGIGTKEFEGDEELSNILGETTEPQAGVLECIFEYVTVKVKRTTESTIEYEIEAPDMKNVFKDLDVNTTDISEDELLQYIKDYAKEAEKKVETVSLDYILENGEPVVDYRNEAFINGVTGGLLDAYQLLYEEMLEEYTEGEN